MYFVSKTQRTSLDPLNLGLPRAVHRRRGPQLLVLLRRLDLDEGLAPSSLFHVRWDRVVPPYRQLVRVVGARDELVYGVGYDVVDVGAARERGVWVANVPDYGTEEVAAHALSMALALLRHLPLYDRSVRDGRWHPASTGPLHRLKNLTLGVVGIGRIGGTFARRAGPWFGRTLGCDPYLEKDVWPEGVEQASLQEVFSESLLISLHAPLTEETRSLVDRSLFERMPEGGYLVNTARGGLVAMDDLLWALEEGPLAGAALDVFPQEPPPASHPLLDTPNVILTPHAAYYSVEAEEEARSKAAQNVVFWAKEGRPIYPVVEGRQG